MAKATRARGWIRTVADTSNASHWEERYRDNDVTAMPWYYPHLDPDFARALDSLEIPAGAAALDLCTGPGTQALALAERGLNVTGADISQTAVVKASELAVKRGLKVHFIQNDILKNRLRQSFDVIIDRGCFHVFPPEQRDEYVRVVSGLVGTEGYLLLKCFSYKQPGSEGPYRIHPDEIRKRFEGRFEMISIEESSFPGENHRRLPKALFCEMRKL
jgi:cyclopropane fatty-acyl-phospholipid synthase-like methyltransferase